MYEIPTADFTKIYLKMLRKKIDNSDYAENRDEGCGKLQFKLSKTATLGTEECGRCGEVAVRGNWCYPLRIKVIVMGR